MIKNIVSIFFLISTLSFSQYSNYSFKKIDINDGLSNNTIYSIFQDSRGFIWFGTKDGLNRFDGYTFTIFRHNPFDSTSIINSKIIDITEDLEKNIWVATRDGISVYNIYKNYFHHYRRNNNSIQSNDINDLCTDNNGNIWIASNDGGLDKFDVKTNQFFSLNSFLGNQFSLEDPNVTSVIQSKDGLIWFVSHVNILSCYDPIKREIKQYPIKVNQLTKGIRKFLFESWDGNLWIGTKGSGVIFFDRNTEKFQQYLYQQGKTGLNNNIVFDLIQINSLSIWMATDGGGINIFDTKKKTFQSIQYNGMPNGLNTNAIYTFLLDKDSSLWIGTFAAGLNVLYPNRKFSCFYHNPQFENSLSYKSVLCFAQDKNNKIWIGTDGGGLNVFDKTTSSFKHLKANSNNSNSLSGNVITSLYIDNTILWIGTYTKGLNKLNLTTNSFTLFTHNSNDINSIGGNTVWDICSNKNEGLWLALHDAGLDYFDFESQQFTHFRYNSNDKNSICSDFVVKVFLDSKNNLWIGTGNKGLNRYNVTTKKIKHYFHQSSNQFSLANNDVREIFEDSEGHIWIGTEGGGLHLFNPEKDNFTIFTIKDGLPNNSIHSILEDSNKNLWISTNNGICEFNLEKKSVKKYDNGDGLQSKEFNEGAGFKLRDNSLLFGGINGFNIIEPGKYKMNPTFPEIIITDFKIFNKSILPNNESFLKKHISLTDTIIISYRQKVISFSFIALNFINSEKNQYKYILENFDKEWINCESRREVSYTNLAPGSYIFRVKASNNDGLWNEKGKSLVLIITPPFWQQWWFRIIFLIVCIFIILLIIRIRLYNLRKRQKELEKQVREKTAVVFQQKEELQAQADDLFEKNSILENQQEEITTQRDKIIEMSKKEQELNQLKFRFFTNISHEFRTPLTLILGPLENLIAKENDLDKIEKYNLIQRNTKRLQNLINQLMDFRKLEAGSLKLSPQLGDIIDFIKQIVCTFENLANSKNIDLYFISETDELNTPFDANKLETIIVNLLSNAFKFTPTGGSIKLDIKMEPRNLIIKVSDTGIGIPEEDHEKIFDQFYQSDFSKDKEGTGIGLSLVKEFVLMHGGTIFVKSKLNIGSEFIFTIPIESGLNISKNNITERISKEITKNTTETSLKNEKQIVLIVEDNDDIRNYIKESIEDEYSIVESINGLEGVKQAKIIIPDIVVSDIMMPEMNGIELTKILKEEELTSHIPIILLTARSSDDHKIQGFDIGADDYITKPFNISVLKSRIKNLIENRKLLIDKFSIDSNKTKETENLFLKKMKEHILKNIDQQNFGTTELGIQMAISRTQLYRKIMAITGQPPNEYIRIIKLNEAARLLKAENLNVNEVSIKTGFSNYTYFSKCFKEHFNVSPSEYIKKNR